MKNFSKIFLVFFLFAVSGFLGFLFSWYNHQGTWSPGSEEKVHFPEAFTQQLKGDPEAGRKIYVEYCGSCHAKNPVIDVNAPAVGDVSAWDKRRKRGVGRLLSKTIHGEGAMPARGGCFECDDKQLQLTIEYMLKSSR